MVSFSLKVPRYSWWSFPSPILDIRTEALDIVPDKKRQMVHIEVHNSSYEKHNWAKVHSNIKTCEVNVNTCPAGDAAARLCLISKHLSTRYYVEISNKKGEKGSTPWYMIHPGLEKYSTVSQSASLKFATLCLLLGNKALGWLSDLQLCHNYGGCQRDGGIKSFK